MNANRELLGMVLALSLVNAPRQQLRAQTVTAPSPVTDSTARLLQRMAQTEARIETTESEVQALKRDLQQMRAELVRGEPLPPAQTVKAQENAAVANAAVSPPEGDAKSTSARTGDEVTAQAAEIATLDQTKVETTSKYPLRITGTILLNSFSNSGKVDQTASPTAALGGPGSTALSMRQTVLGLNADGPRVWGGTTRADVRVDFFGGYGTQSNGGAGGSVRLRTAHVAMQWRRTEAFFALDHPLLSPNQPDSLLALAQPELAWSGNLWSWNPQVGLTQTWGKGTRLRLQAALIDPADPTFPATTPPGGGGSPSLAEQSRRPGLQARVAVLGSGEERRSEFGIGGYISRHAAPTDTPANPRSFDAWAATLDYRLALGRGFRLTGSAYRGQALGGLGAGAYKDYVYRATATGIVARPLDDIGGWVQLHQSVLSRLEWNAGFGLDNAFSREVREDPTNTPANVYGGIARNRTIYANVIYGPSAWLLFSLEYRHLYTAPAPGPVWISNSTGVGAAYRF